MVAVVYRRAAEEEFSESDLVTSEPSLVRTVCDSFSLLLSFLFLGLGIGFVKGGSFGLREPVYMAFFEERGVVVNFFGGRRRGFLFYGSWVKLHPAAELGFCLSLIWV